MSGRTMKRALTIAGSDSGGGAGIQADLKTFAALGVFGTSAITALTAQNTLGVLGVFAVTPEFVSLQIDAVAADIGSDAVKTGMLANAAIIQAVAAKLQEHRLGPLVVDPVMVAKGGDRLLEPQAGDALIQVLLPLAAVVTPNLPEAEALCGFPVEDLEGMRRAARAIRDMGPRCVVVKGGHLERAGSAGAGAARAGAAGDAASRSVDLFFDGTSFEELAADRVDTHATHGTGCTFASAVAARMARGDSPLDAVRAAKAYVTAIIRASAHLGIGSGHGPMDHFALFTDR